MDGLLKDFAKIERAWSAGAAVDPSSSKQKEQAIASTIEALVQSLRELREQLQAGGSAADVAGNVSRVVDETKKDIESRMKEIQNQITKFGKALDSVCIHYDTV
jgi:E3 ubiquitin-protein transferase RMND5